MPVVFPKFCFQYANSRTAAKDRQESQFCGSPVYVFFLMLKTTPRKGDISKVKPSLFSLNTPSALRRVFVVFQFAISYLYVFPSSRKALLGRLWADSSPCLQSQQFRGNRGRGAPFL